MSKHPGGTVSKHPAKQIVLASRPKGLPTPETPFRDFVKSITQSPIATGEKQ